MNKINLHEFKEDIYQTISLLSIVDIDKLLALNKKYTADEIFINITKNALLYFERYYPYRTTLKLPNTVCSTNEVHLDSSWVDTYYHVDGNTVIKFYENYEQVFYNLISEADLALIPLKIKGLKNSRTTDHTSIYRQFTYERPYLFGVNKGSYSYYSGIFQWPVYTDMKDTEIVSLKNTYVLFMSEGSDTYRTFKYLMIVRLCEYLLNLKNNFSLPGLPVEVFGALDQVASTYKEITQTEFSSAQASWGWD